MHCIKEFKGEYYFLSNFFHSPFQINGKFYPTVEHFYQASKAFHNQDHELIRLAMTPGIAKRKGQKIILRSDWDEVKEFYMYVALKAKFQNSFLNNKLLITDGLFLIEGNKWGDTYWGKILYTDIGQNRLGYLLMKLRKDLIEQ